MLWLSLLASGVRTSRSECPGQQVIEARLRMACGDGFERVAQVGVGIDAIQLAGLDQGRDPCPAGAAFVVTAKECRSEEHTSELQSRENLVCRLLLEKKKISDTDHPP